MTTDIDTRPADAAPARTDAAETRTISLSVLYGSQTGNAEFLAAGIVDAASAQGYAAELLSLADLTPEEAAHRERILIVTATHDNGHMPDNAQAFWSALQDADGSLFEGVPFAVLAIGDSMYEDFCKAGADLDGRIGELGGARVLDRIDCDVDYDFTSGPWIKKMLETFKTVSPRANSSPSLSQALIETSAGEPARASRRDPDSAKVVHARRLSAPDAAKEVWHYELQVEGDSANYRPGDSLAIIPLNSADLVEAVLAHLGLDGEETPDAGPRTLRSILREDCELRLPHIGLLAALADRLDGQHPLRALLECGDRNALEDWLWGRDVLDVLQESGTTGLGAAELLSMLRPIQHRAYSISSSPRVDADRIHLTVSTVRYGREGRDHRGVCSRYLHEAAQTEEQFGVFPLPAHEFHVPEDGAADVIMIGPGVGVAPFRGFLREREASGARGRNWLYFGDQHRKPKWLYQDEMEAMADRGFLERLSLAFSRDGDRKVYVQDRMREEGQEFFSWLDSGAYVFVCGDKRRMAPDIDRAMIDLVREYGAMSEEAAMAYVQGLKDAGRYIKDVY